MESLKFNIDMKRFIVIMVSSLVCISGFSQNFGSVLSSIRDKVVKETVTSASSMVGTWEYAGPECHLESDNALASIGGEAASVKLENELSGLYEKIGMDNVTYTFASDGTFSCKASKVTTSGTYTFDSGTGTVTMTSRLGVSFTAYVTVTGSRMTLSFNADRLFDALGKLSGYASEISSMGASLQKLMDSYDGLRLGFTLEKQQL